MRNINNGIPKNDNNDNDYYIQLFNQIQTNPIRKDYHGRPIIPEVALGSISHKGEYAVGLATLLRSTGSDCNDVVNWREECPVIYSDDDNNDDDDDAMSNGVSDKSGTNYPSTSESSQRGIGIDLERIDDGRGKRIARKILTENEQKNLGGLEEIGVSSEEEVMLRFSLKESVYKAMHPILCQYVGFQEAEITPFPDGTAEVMLNLTSNAHEQLGIVVQSASWKKVGDFFLTSASVGVAPTNDV